MDCMLYPLQSSQSPGWQEYLAMLNLTIFCYQVTMIIITNMVSFKTPSKEDVIISVLQIRKLRFRVITTCTKTQSPHSLEAIGRIWNQVTLTPKSRRSGLPFADLFHIHPGSPGGEDYYDTGCSCLQFTTHLHISSPI